MTPKDCCKNRDFCCTWNTSLDCIELKKNHNYMYQVQGQLGVYDNEWADLFVWTKKSSSTQRITFDKDLWLEMVPKLKQFYAKNLVAEMYTARVCRGKVLYP